MKIIINGFALDKEQLLSLIDSGNKLVAIKIIKEQTNLGLKDCKDIADNLSVSPNYYDGRDIIIESDYIAYNEDNRMSSPKPPPPPPPTQRKQPTLNRSKSYSSPNASEKFTKTRGYLKDERDSNYNIFIVMAIIISIGIIGYFLFNK